jgi:hypothetical protein
LQPPKKAFEDGQKLFFPVGKSASKRRRWEIGNRMIIEVGIKFTLLKEERVEGWGKYSVSHPAVEKRVALILLSIYS